MADIFASGFETGDTTEWDVTNESPTVVSSQSHCGTYSCYCNSADEEVRENFSAVTEVYGRAYLRFKDLNYYGYDSIGGIQFWGNSGANIICQAKVFGTSGYTRIGIQRWYPSDQTSYYTYAINEEQWYCFELYFKKHASAGEYKIWIDGNLVINQTGLDTSSAPDADQFRSGQTASSYGGAGVWTDCNVISESYIGTHDNEFTDGFESGDISLWDASDDSPSVQQLHCHCGVYALENNITQYGAEGPYINLGHHKQIYLQFEVKFDDASPTTGDYVEFLQIGRSGLSLLKLRIKNVSGTVKWGIVYQAGGSTTEVYSGTSTNPSSLTWYCVEIRILCSDEDGSGVGIYDMWVDGTNLADIKQTAIDTDYTGITYLRARTTTDDPNGATVWYDCFVFQTTDPDACHVQGSEEVPTITEPDECEPEGYGRLQVFRNCQQIGVIDVKVEDESRGVGSITVPLSTKFVEEDLVHIINEGFRCIQGKVTEIDERNKEGVKILTVQTKTSRLFGRFVLNSTHQIYESQDAGLIFSDLITYYFNGLFDDDYVETNTGFIISDADFGEQTVGSACEELAKRSGGVFRVDHENHVHFYLEGSRSSGVTLDRTNILDLDKVTVAGLINKVIVKGYNVTGTAGSGIPEYMHSDRRISTEEEAQEVAEALLEKLGGSKVRTVVSVAGFLKVYRGETVVVNFPQKGYDNETLVIKEITWDIKNNVTQLTVGDATRPTLESALGDTMQQTKEQQVNRISPHQGNETADTDPFLIRTNLLDQSLPAEVRVQTADITLNSGACSSEDDAAEWALITVELEIGASGGSGYFILRLINTTTGDHYEDWLVYMDSDLNNYHKRCVVLDDVSGDTIQISAEGYGTTDVYVRGAIRVDQAVQHSHSTSQSDRHEFD